MQYFLKELHYAFQHGKAIVLYCAPAQVKAIHGQYKPELLVYDVWAETVAEGLELLDWLKTNT